jgi:hypothetical protein
MVVVKKVKAMPKKNLNLVAFASTVSTLWVRSYQTTCFAGGC